MMVGKFVVESCWSLWTEQKIVEIKVGRFENQARYSVLSVGGKKLNDIWVLEAAEKEEQFCFGSLALPAGLELFANKLSYLLIRSDRLM